MGDAAVRRRLVRLAVLPAGLIALTGAATVTWLLRSCEGAGSLGAPLWGVLAVGAVVAGTVLAAATAFAVAEARGTAERCAALRRATLRGQAELRSMLWALRHGERPVARTRAPQGEPDGDGLDLLAYQAALAQCGAEAAVAEAAALTGRSGGGGAEKMEVFVSLARRLQSLVHREIRCIDELEHEVEDPDLLKGVFHVDHLATRIRRHSENLAVLGGAVAHRRWTRPVSLSEVLRSAIAEVEHYTRVQLVPPIDGAVRGHAVADVIHLLAELIENATVFSAPETHVLVRTQLVTAGLAVEIEDRGLGMNPGEQQQLNAVLAEPTDIDVPALVRDGRIGLYVVAALARRHGVVVQLQHNIYGGVQAVAVLPRRLLGEAASDGQALGESSGTLPTGGQGGGTSEAAGTAGGGTGGAGGTPFAGSATKGSATKGPVAGSAVPSPAAGPVTRDTTADPAVPGAPSEPATKGPVARAGPGDAGHRSPSARQGGGPGDVGRGGDPDGDAPGPAFPGDPRPRSRARGTSRGPATPAPPTPSHSTDPATRSADLAGHLTEPASHPADPATPPADVAGHLTDPASPPADSASRPAEPGERPSNATDRPTNAAAGPAGGTGHRGKGARDRAGRASQARRPAASAQQARGRGRGAYPASGEGTDAAEGEAGRPPLPRRQRQARAGAEARESPPRPEDAHGGTPRDPGLMAAFRRSGTPAHGVDGPAGGSPPPDRGEERDHGE